MSAISQNQTYLTSKEAKKLLKVSDCHLAHLREEGKLPFVKKGNAYMYEEKYVVKFYDNLSNKISNLM